MTKPNARTNTQQNTPVPNLASLKRIHLIGIGGAGLSAIAKVLLEMGFQVSGSDLLSNALTEQLRAQGADVFRGHAPAHVEGADLVVVSSAIPEDNPERQEALRLGIPVVKRGPLLAALTAEKQTIAIAGSHGKTTTAGMVAHILNEAGLDPTFIIGGVLENFGTNARLGRGRHFVMEADEYDRTFLALHPHISVITSVEMDHPDCFSDEDELCKSFGQFAAQTADGGLLLGLGDDPQTARLVQEVSAERDIAVETFGFPPTCTWAAADLEMRADGTTGFTVMRGGSPMMWAELALPGEHNVLNALAAVAVASHLAIAPEDTARALRSFEGTRRRLEVRGASRGVTVLDDYAHHPTQIAATLKAVRQKYGGGQLWAVFQPHTYSRLKSLWADFAACFRDAHHVLVLPVYAAREAPDSTVDPAQLAREMPHPDAQFAAGLQDAASALATRVRSGDTVITLGAGDEWKVGDQLLALLQRELAQTLHQEECNHEQQSI